MLDSRTFFVLSSNMAVIPLSFCIYRDWLQTTHSQASVKRQVDEETRDRRFTLHTKVNKMPVMQDVMVRQDGKFVAIFAMTNIKFPKN